MGWNVNQGYLYIKGFSLLVIFDPNSPSLLYYAMLYVMNWHKMLNESYTFCVKEKREFKLCNECMQAIYTYNVRF